MITLDSLLKIFEKLGKMVVETEKLELSGSLRYKYYDLLDGISDFAKELKRKIISHEN